MRVTTVIFRIILDYIGLLYCKNGKSWNEQAYKAAKNYLNTMSFSLDNLINQLEADAGDKYTHEQAVYGAEKAYNE